MERYVLPVGEKLSALKELQCLTAGIWWWKSSFDLSKRKKKKLTKGHGITSQRTWIFSNTAVRNWNVAQHADCSVRTNTGEPVKTLTTSTDLVNKLYRRDFEFYSKHWIFSRFSYSSYRPKRNNALTNRTCNVKKKTYRGVKADNKEFLILVLGLVMSGPLPSLTS